MFSGYEGESLSKLLHKISRSQVVMMDRWQIEFSSTEETEEKGDPIPYNIINNYFSIGVVSERDGGCFTICAQLSKLQSQGERSEGAMANSFT